MKELNKREKQLLVCLIKYGVHKGLRIFSKQFRMSVKDVQKMFGSILVKTETIEEFQDDVFAEICGLDEEMEENNESKN